MNALNEKRMIATGELSVAAMKLLRDGMTMTEIQELVKIACEVLTPETWEAFERSRPGEPGCEHLTAPGEARPAARELTESPPPPSPGLDLLVQQVTEAADRLERIAKALQENA